MGSMECFSIPTMQHFSTSVFQLKINRSQILNITFFSFVVFSACPSKEDEMAARLRRKAELQKKASKSMTYRSSFQAEIGKQKEMSSRTKEEKRNALCEELGRGC